MDAIVPVHDGSWVGYDPEYTNPLDDPKHPFNSLVPRTGGDK